MRVFPGLVALTLLCPPLLHTKQSEVERCTAGSALWQGKAGKFRVILDGTSLPEQCRLSVKRDDQEVFSTQAKVIEVLARGSDVNMDGKPDLAFQTGPSGACCWTLHILSLEKPPRLVGGIQNQFPFTYQEDEKMGTAEFVTQDGALAAGFDGLVADELTSLPTLAIQWEGARPVDASSRHASEYAGIAAKLASQLRPEQVLAFKRSDGKLDTPTSEVQLLRKTKAQVLAATFAYRYAGFSGSAWSNLEELWPESDAPRIRKLITDTLESGLESRLARPPVLMNSNCGGTGDPAIFKVGGKVKPARPSSTPDPQYTEEARHANFQGTVVLNAVISAEGCVRELRLVRRLGRELDEKAMEAVLGWKFEPARLDGKPVAVRVNIEVNFRLY